MRLIDCSTYELREFCEKQIPRYAILSHRWEEDGEVSFQDLNAGRGPEMRGWSKIEGCCKQASKDGWRYCVSLEAFSIQELLVKVTDIRSREWIDSCCIDKTSSAELSEAINSMFEWYRKAEVCYAYLSDVDSGKIFSTAVEQDFKNSAWFTRGWTLQELLAPQWPFNLDQVYHRYLSSIQLFDASIAQKMCWASLRQTTRIEDQAYCLLGIFGVHMPPLYGEGANAFHRLQLEIMSQSDDESIFAWEGRSNVIAGLLAASPRQFHLSGSIVRLGLHESGRHMKRQPYSMTNQGLRLELLLRETSSTPLVYGKKSKRTFVAPLNCAWESENAGSLWFVGLPLCRDFYDAELPDDGLRNWFRQGRLERFNNLEAGSLKNKIVFAETVMKVPVFSRPQCVVVKVSLPWEPPFTIRRRIDPHSDASWSLDRSEGEVLKSFYKSDETGVLIYEDESSAFAVVLGSSSFVFWIDIIVEPEILQRLDAIPEMTLDSQIKPDTSQGGGDRVFKELSDGRVVSAQTKKELRAATYRFIVDVAITRSGQSRPGDLEFSSFHQGELDIGGDHERSNNRETRFVLGNLTA